MAVNSIKNPKLRVKTTLEWMHQEIVLIAQDMAKLAEIIAKQDRYRGLDADQYDLDQNERNRENIRVM